VANALAYYDAATITAVNSFIVQALGIVTVCFRFQELVHFILVDPDLPEREPSNRFI